MAELTPTFPTGAHDWAAFILIVALGLFKLDRGTVMARRARYVDRLGLSFIVFDLAFSVTFLLNGASILYPDYTSRSAVFWFTFVLLFSAMAWQWIEVRIAAGQRIHAAVSGTTEIGDTWEPGDPDRRNGEPGRRLVDYERTG